MPDSFIDTDVLAYVVSGDRAKAERAERIARAGGAISVQVLNELANVLLRKLRRSRSDTHEFLSLVRSLLTVHPVTVNVHETGLDLAERYRLATFDAMIAAAALHADCRTLWSEDMQHGLLIDRRLRVLNPFRA